MSRITPIRGVICFIAGCLFLPTWAAVATDVQGRKLDVDPKIVKKAALEYPGLFLNDLDRAFRGTAVVEFVVTEKGEVANPKITKVSHPAFVPPALDALFKTKFAPGEIGGQPVACRFVYVFSFDVTGFVQGRLVIGSDPFTLPAETPPDCPEQFRYDVAPRPVFISEPVYPRELLLNKVEGEAKVLFVVDKTGRVVESKVLSATQPEFGVAMRAAVETWRFTPPYYEHRATMTLVSRSHKFSPKNQELASDTDSGRVLRMLRARDHIVDAATLPQMPRLRYEAPMIYPTAFEEKRVEGEAQIEFNIDRKGRVRLPRVISATHPLFGWAAATAVQQLYYEPPQGGRRAGGLVGGVSLCV
jgi:TonB family protein